MSDKPVTLTKEMKRDLGAQMLAMSIRENIMTYFKGDTSKILLPNPGGLIGLNLESERSGSRQDGRPYLYERRENDLASEVAISLGEVKLCTLKKSPDTVEILKTTFDGVLSRKILRPIRDSILSTLENYLPGVDIVFVTQGRGSTRTRLVGTMTNTETLVYAYDRISRYMNNVAQYQAHPEDIFAQVDEASARATRVRWTDTTGFATFDEIVGL